MRIPSKTILIATTIIIGLAALSGCSSTSEAVNNVSMADGKQIIKIQAKGGYSPKVTTAKADTPTTIEVSTQSTFDCSSALVIPSLNYRKNLPPSGTTDIEVPAQKAGTKLQGLCAMGMYSFVVNFN